MKDIVLHSNPQLSNPEMVIGFGGWPDVAGVSLGTVRYLRNRLPMDYLAEIDSDEFYDFSQQRPLATVHNGRLQHVETPANDFYFWRGNTGRDLILLLGTEPNLRWNRYVNSVLDLAEYFKVKRIYTVGGEYDRRMPHTIESRVAAAVNTPCLAEEMQSLDIDLVEHYGPASVHTLLLSACDRRNIEAICLWAAAPYYVPGHNLSLWITVLHKLVAMLKVEVDLTEIQGAGKAMEKEIAGILARNADMQKQVNRLESQYQAGRKVTPARAIEDLIKDVERFLKEQRGTK